MCFFFKVLHLFSFVSSPKAARLPSASKNYSFFAFAVYLGCTFFFLFWFTEVHASLTGSSPANLWGEGLAQRHFDLSFSLNASFLFYIFPLAFFLLSVFVYYPILFLISIFFLLFFFFFFLSVVTFSKSSESNTVTIIFIVVVVVVVVVPTWLFFFLPFFLYYHSLCVFCKLARAAFHSLFFFFSTPARIR